MKEKSIITEDKNQNITLFRDLPDAENYSRYSKQLNKIFSYHSYSKFCKNLNRKDQRKIITFKDQVRKWFSLSNKSTDLRRFEKFDIEKFKLCLEKMEIKELSLFNKKKDYLEKRNHNRKIINAFTKNKLLQIKNKEKNMQKPDIGKYNPKYEIIGKHVYQVSFGQNFYDFNNTKTEDNSILGKTKNIFNIKSKTLYNSHNHNHINETLKTSNKKIIKAKTQTKMTGVDKINKNIKSRNKKIKNLKTANLFKEIHLNNFEKEEKSIENLTKEKAFNKGRNKSNINDSNHTNDYSLFFPKLKKRFNANNNTKENTDIYPDSFSKTLFNKSLSKNNQNFTIRDYSLNVKQKGNVNFNNISSGKKNACFFDVMAKKNRIPPVGIYDPSYSLIFSRTKNVYFDRGNSNKKLKKKLFNKIFADYHPTIEYELFSSLNENSNNNSVNKNNGIIYK